MNKRVFRCVIIFPKGKGGGGSIFLRASDKQQAETDARKVMDDTFIERGHPKTNFEVEVYPSSEEEILAYRAKMRRNAMADKMVN